MFNTRSDSKVQNHVLIQLYAYAMISLVIYFIPFSLLGFQSIIQTLVFQ
jgi:hypothetical protein